jgi:hypothetical protein
MKGIIQELIDKGGIPGAGKSGDKYKDYTDVQNKARGMKAGGMVSSASKRADGCAVKGKTKGKMV